MRAISESGERPPETTLVTGFPAFTAKCMVRKILRTDPEASLFLLSRDKFTQQAEEFRRELPATQADRLEIMEGDVCSMDLGLSGAEFRRVTATTTTIHHQAGIYYMGVDKETASRVNVEGTRGIIELAYETKHLRRLCHWSTANVAGKRSGTIQESELDVGQEFHNFYESTKCKAEKLARAAQRNLPITILRPGVIVGDSKTGEIDKFDGPYYLMVLITSNSSQLHIPMLGRGQAPLHLVPIDYVINAAYALSMDDRAAGLSFHLTDPNPLPARHIFECIAELSGTRLSRNSLPMTLTKTLLRAPGLQGVARAPRSFLESMNQTRSYSRTNTDRLLRDSDIQCPHFDEYAPRLLEYLKSVRNAQEQEFEGDVFDPFD